MSWAKTWAECNLIGQLVSLATFIGCDMCHAKKFTYVISLDAHNLTRLASCDHFTDEGIWV